MTLSEANALIRKIKTVLRTATSPAATIQQIDHLLWDACREPDPLSPETFSAAARLVLLASDSDCVMLLSYKEGAGLQCALAHNLVHEMPDPKFLRKLCEAYLSKFDPTLPS